MESVEIERKFLVRDLPVLTNYEKTYERYFLYRSQHVELRVQKKGEEYELERKEGSSILHRVGAIMKISKEEYEKLIESTSESIIRDSYLISKDPEISIKIYHETYAGLMRAEVEFTSVEELKNFQPLPWMGKEITDTPLGRDSELITLSREEFVNLLRSYSET